MLCCCYIQSNMLDTLNYLDVKVMLDIYLLVINHGFKNVLETTVFGGSESNSLSSKETIDEEPWCKPHHSLQSRNTTNGAKIKKE